MAIELYIWDASELVTLSSTDAYLIEYTPKSPELDERSVGRIGEDGETLLYAKRKNVVETASIDLIGGTVTATANLQKLERLLAQAERYARSKRGNPVYVYFRPDTSLTLYRSPIYKGRVTPDDELLSWQWINGVFQVEVSWERAYYWEASDLTQIPLTNGNGTNNTSGLTVYAHDDGDAGHDSFVTINAAAVLGSIPTPAYIYITNSYNVAQNAKTICVGQNVFGQSTLFTHTLEGESATGGSNSASGSASGGNYKTFSWSGTSETNIGNWTISSSQIDYAAGTTFRPILRLHGKTAYTDLYIRLRVVIGGVNQHVTSWFLVDSTNELQIFDFAFSLPPSTYVYIASSISVSVYIDARRATSGSHTLAVDFLQLLALDGWRKYSSLVTLAYNEIIEDHPDVDAVVSVTASGAAKTHNAEGNPIMLIPNRQQRLYFVRDQSDGNAPIAATATVKVWYRARKLIL